MRTRGPGLPGTPVLGRRAFLRGALGAAASAAALAAGYRAAGAGAAPAPSPSHGPSGLRIRRITRFEVPCVRPHRIAPNSHMRGRGVDVRESVLRIETDGGIDGVQFSYATREQAAPLLGRDPLDFFTPEAGVVSPLGPEDPVLWDLVGRILGQPVWRLLGAGGSEWVPVYDGTIYFEDLAEEGSDRGADAVVAAAEASAAQGHRAIKLKIGRGYRWMERTVGLKRDVEVVRRVHAALGDDVVLMVDANNGLGEEDAYRFVREVGAPLRWIEEPFPERVEACQAFRSELARRVPGTWLADGESADDAAPLAPFVAARAIDCLQPDMRQFGITQMARFAATTRAAGLALAPHNFGSYLGFHLIVALGRGVPGVVYAERDPMRCPAFPADGFELRDGRMRAPDRPGCGLEFDPRGLDRHSAATWTLS